MRSGWTVAVPGQMPQTRLLRGAALLTFVAISALAWIAATPLFSLRPAAGFTWALAAVLATIAAAGLWLTVAEIRRYRQGVDDYAARLSAVIDSAVDGIIVIDDRGRIESFNPAAERLFGYQPSEVIGRNVSTLMPSPHHEEHDGYLLRYLETGEAKIIGKGREVIARRRDGTTFPLHLSVGEMTISGQRKFTGIVHDLSARVRLEQQLREKGSLAMVGEMAAVIAHEVKNPLAGVRGAIEVIGGRLPPGSGDAAMIKEILGRVDALSELMKDILLFARPPQPRMAPVELTKLMQLTAALAAGDPALQRVRIEIEGSAPPVQADAELLKIVFLNLLVNSAQAMQGEGTIHVVLANGDSTCVIRFADTGPGISADTRDKVFTPFFTTKTRGSGLGLATAKSIVEAHSGTISVVSPPSGGTTIVIELPARSA